MRKGLLVVVAFLAGAVVASHHARLARVEARAEAIEGQVSEVRGRLNRIDAPAPRTDAGPRDAPGKE
jgi:hypothetical protein